MSKSTPAWHAVASGGTSTFRYMISRFPKFSLLILHSRSNGSTLSLSSEDVCT
jgi:hypothetical protein